MLRVWLLKSLMRILVLLRTFRQFDYYFFFIKPEDGKSLILFSFVSRNKGKKIIALNFCSPIHRCWNELLVINLSIFLFRLSDKMATRIQKMKTNASVIYTCCRLSCWKNASNISHVLKISAEYKSYRLCR